MSFKNIMKIKPCDNLFLGSGKSFSKGRNTWINTRLMPFPSVFFGAICSLMLANNDYKKNDYIINKNGEYDPREFLSLGRIYLYDEKNKRIYIPAPLDLYIDDKGHSHYAKVNKIEEKFKCSCSEYKYLFFNEVRRECERADGMFMNLSSFYYSYFYVDTSLKIIRKSEITSDAYKVGIQIDEKNNTAQQEHLYRIDLTEFKDHRWSFLVEYEIDNWWDKNEYELKNGYLKLGGENKVCKFHCYEREKFIKNYDNETIINKSELIKMILLSPCVFKEGGDRPDFEDIEIVAAATGKAYDIGGFDMKINKHKPMDKAVPEGAVFILKSKDFNNKSISDIKNLIQGHMEKECVNFKHGFGNFEIVPFYERYQTNKGEL